MTTRHVKRVIFLIIVCHTMIDEAIYNDKVRAAKEEKNVLTKNKRNFQQTQYNPAIMTKDVSLLDENGKQLFAQAKAELGPLQRGECYGFFPALAMGGGAKID